jgi:hypothetical protein
VACYKLVMREQFIPKAFGNDKEARPVVFSIHFPTMKEREEIREWKSYVDILDSGSISKKAIKMTLAGAKAIQLCVDSIEGLETEDETGAKKAITTGKEFIELPHMDEMQGEVSLHISEYAGRDIKNS